MRILLIDEQVLVMAALKSLLVAHGFEVVGTASNQLDAFYKTKMLKPEVILMGIPIAGNDGIETTRCLRQMDPELKIVMLSGFQDDGHLFEAVKAGVFGYLLKSMSQADFLEALNKLANGEAPFAAGLVAKVLAQFALREKERENAAAIYREVSAILTPLQITILKMVSQGLIYKQIGRQLGLSEAAIKYHMSEITRRLQLKNRLQVVAYASKLGVGKTAQGSYSMESMK